MRHRILFVAMVVGLMGSVPHYCAGRGFGGGGFAGGGGAHIGGGGMGGGGFGGGMHPGGGGMGGGGFSGGVRPGGMGGGGFGGGNFGGGNFGGGNFGGLGGGGLGGGNFGGFNQGGFDRGNFGGGIGAGGLEGRGLGGAGLGQGGFENRPLNRDFNGQPSRAQLNNFLGLPSDEGMHSLNQTQNHPKFDDNFDVNHGTIDGPRGGSATGTTITGPRGNTVGRGAAEGPNGGVVAGRGVEGAGAGKAGQGIAVGPNGRIASGGAAVGPNGGAAARGFVAGPNGVAAGFARVTPSGRYTTAVGVRTNFNHWDVYGRGWYDRHPGAWFAAGWATGAAWNTATWATVGDWCGYAAEPMYYDYGNNVTYEDNSVYMNGQQVGSAEDYYNQAMDLAAEGSGDAEPADGNWLPLGVFALSKNASATSDVVIQLAVNRDGFIRGNYTDTVTNKTQTVIGSVDKKTQRVAFQVGDNKTAIIETGLYNLTKSEAPALVHLDKDRTEQWLLVRMNKGGQDDAVSR